MASKFCSSLLSVQSSTSGLILRLIRLFRWSCYSETARSLLVAQWFEVSSSLQNKINLNSTKINKVCLSEISQQMRHRLWYLLIHLASSAPCLGSRGLRKSRTSFHTSKQKQTNGLRGPNTPQYTLQLVKDVHVSVQRLVLSKELLQHRGWEITPGIASRHNDTRGQSERGSQGFAWDEKWQHYETHVLCCDGRFFPSRSLYR